MLDCLPLWKQCLGFCYLGVNGIFMFSQFLYIEKYSQNYSMYSMIIITKSWFDIKSMCYCAWNYFSTSGVVKVSTKIDISAGSRKTTSCHAALIDWRLGTMCQLTSSCLSFVLICMWFIYSYHKISYVYCLLFVYCCWHKLKWHFFVRNTCQVINK